MLYAKLHYTFKAKEMSPEAWDKFVLLWPGATRDEKQDGYHTWEHTRQRISMDEAAELEKIGVKLEIEGVDGTYIAKMKNGRRWGWGDDVTARHLLEGSAVQVTIPDMALLAITEVEWLDDACTQAVQDKLDEGWRILAVCPPNGQRRPDYIFGRRKP